MEGIKNLTEYIQIVCENPRRNNYSEQASNDQLSPKDRASIFTEEISTLPKPAKDPLITEELDSYIQQNYERIYGCRYQMEHERRAKQGTFFYRGVSNEKYPITSGIYRKNETHEENYYFNEINVRCPDTFRSLDNLEKLTYMQHYGCPTRLLDITSNPLVALYFACQNDQKDGVVYFFCVATDEIRYANSDRVQMLSKFSEFGREDQRQLRRLAYYYLFSEKFKQVSNSKYQDPVIEQYYHAVKRNNIAFEREIKPFDLLCPQFVQPNKDNPRILKQDGAFIISGLDADEKESNMKIRKFVVNEIFISAANKANLRYQLEQVDINMATLFPEVDKVAEYLRQRL